MVASFASNPSPNHKGASSAQHHLRIWHLPCNLLKHPTVLHFAAATWNDIFSPPLLFLKVNNRQLSQGTQRPTARLPAGHTTKMGQYCSLTQQIESAVCLAGTDDGAKSNDVSFHLLGQSESVGLPVCVRPFLCLSQGAAADICLSTSTACSHSLQDSVSAVPSCKLSDATLAVIMFGKTQNLDLNPSAS